MMKISKILRTTILVSVLSVTISITACDEDTFSPQEGRNKRQTLTAVDTNSTMFNGEYINDVENDNHDGENCLE